MVGAIIDIGLPCSLIIPISDPFERCVENDPTVKDDIEIRTNLQ